MNFASLASLRSQSYRGTSCQFVRGLERRSPKVIPRAFAVAIGAIVALRCADACAEDRSDLVRAVIDRTGPGWSRLGENDFANVNCDRDTWTWNDGDVHCTGSPIGVLRTKKPWTNFEFLVSWRHLTKGGNSGVFVWTPEDSLRSLKPGNLPSGIEVQILDLGYAEKYEKQTGKKADWFTAHGDVFSVGTSKMTPFPPAGPEGQRSFPRKHLSKGSNEWNHYYLRCINGEVRLWVNGEEVSGGTRCEPRTGYLCLESEGAPVDFRELWIRELP